jgi:hypothetical protein
MDTGVSRQHDISDSGDGDSPCVQRREGPFTSSELGVPDVHIGSPSPMGKTLAATVGSPLDHDCPACRVMRGEPCRSASTHYDRVRLIRIVVP